MKYIVIILAIAFVLTSASAGQMKWFRRRRTDGAPAGASPPKHAAGEHGRR